jgi:hypothetical protein
MSDPQPDPDLIALGIRQPWAELILRGVKTIEVRSQDTKVRGAVYLYSSKKPADVEPAVAAAREYGIEPDELPMGVIVGTVDIVDSAPCRPADAAASCVPGSYLTGRFGWTLANPVRFDEPLTVRFLPYGVWFYPFKRRGSTRRRRR